MRKQSKIFFLIVGLLLLQITLNYAHRAIPDNTYQIVDSFNRIPEDIGGFKFQRDIELDPISMRALDPDGLIFKDYVGPPGTGPISLVIVYHRNERWGAHDPDGCYTSQGWKILESAKPHTIRGAGDDLHVNKIVVEKSGRYNLVYYWYFDDKLQTHSRLKHWLFQIPRILIKKSSGYGMVRVSQVVSDQYYAESLDTYALSMAATIRQVF